MGIPAEMRVKIYKYVYEDSAPAKLELASDGDDGLDDDSSTTTTSGAKSEAEESALPAETFPTTKTTSYVNLLTAKDLYPEVSLLCTSHQISKEVLPIFKSATDAFWSAEIFDVSVDIPEEADAMLEYAKIRTRLESMSLLQTHGIKLLNLGWLGNNCEVEAHEGEIPSICWGHYAYGDGWTTNMFVVDEAFEEYAKTITVGDGATALLHVPDWLDVFFEAMLLKGPCT